MDNPSLEELDMKGNPHPSLPNGEDLFPGEVPEPFPFNS